MKPETTVRRLGVVGIVVADRQSMARRVNEILSDFGEIIVARTGVPYRERGVAVISVIIDATTNELGALTGRLGMLEHVRVKSLML
ncbi:TM1266 family iron-only hydrogenase system putative regulator [Paucidesulfovibrio longus]|uniref:TM1266 family iron-only hydrogenase system putative regulator n=1 Tax=Paucidesulfovibrio longus TaxID=889 RepID=UPI0003B6E7C1|nr:TM1266 family iron-only hydrogenase system putative regulator [Paucidesulfovibrio longus]